jgi:hypothetical protein
VALPPRFAAAAAAAFGGCSRRTESKSLVHVKLCPTRNPSQAVTVNTHWPGNAIMMMYVFYDSRLELGIPARRIKRCDQQLAPELTNRQLEPQVVKLEAEAQAEARATGRVPDHRQGRLGGRQWSQPGIVCRSLAVPHCHRRGLAIPGPGLGRPGPGISAIIIDHDMRKDGSESTAANYY